MHSPRSSLSSIDTTSTSDSMDLLAKHRQNLEDQKKRLQRHQKFLSRRKKQNEEKERKEMVKSPMPASPIRTESPKHQNSPSTHELHLASKGHQFLQERERKLEALRRSRDMILESELQDTPQLTERTRKLVERTRRRKSQQGFPGPSLVASFSSNGSHGTKPVEDQLMEKEYARRHSIFMQAERQYALENPGTPKITPQAARMIREGSVTDRLFEMASMMGEKKRFHAMQKRLQEEQSLTFEPRVHESSESVSHSRTMPVYLDLLQRDEQRKMKKLEKIERLMEKEKDLHKPKINPVSQEIASRLPSTSRERLLAPSKKRQSTGPQLEEDQFPFRPEICAKSREIEAEKELSSTERIDKLYQRDRKRREKIEDLRSFYEQKELEECTFAPKTSAAADEYARSRKRSALSRVPFSERAQQWQEKRESKINVKRKNIEAKELENCTFHPNIVTLQDDDVGGSMGAGDYSRHTTMSQSQFMQQDMGEHNVPVQPSGYTEFVKRQQEARRRKEQKNNGVFITGGKWKNRVTVPKEFKLGMSRQQRKHVSSIHGGTMGSPSFVQRAVHKQIERLNTSFEESPSEKRHHAPEPERLHTSVEKENHRASARSFKAGTSARNGGSSRREAWREESPVASSLDDEDDDSMEHIPPQGLFSAGGTLSILQGLNFAYT